MPPKFADRLSSVAPSATLAMGAKARKLRAEGHKVFDFSIGEPDFDTPVHIRDAAKHALDAGATRYTPTTGTAELKAPMALKSSRWVKPMERAWPPPMESPAMARFSRPGATRYSDSTRGMTSLRR